MVGIILYIVIPCYNEQEVISETARLLSGIYDGLIQAGKIGELSRILFVNDGSCDETWEQICELHRNNPCFIGLSLSRVYWKNIYGNEKKTKILRR